jgi:hypothetical protein
MPCVRRTTFLSGVTPGSRQSYGIFIIGPLTFSARAENYAKPLRWLSSRSALRYFRHWLSLILSSARASSQRRTNCETYTVEGRTILIGDVDFSGRRRLHSTRRSGDSRMNVRMNVRMNMKGASHVGDLRILVRTALRCLAPEAAVDYRRCLQSARRSTVCRPIIQCQSSGLQVNGEGVVPPASSTAEGFCYWRCHGSMPPNAPQLALAPKDRSGRRGWW